MRPRGMNLSQVFKPCTDVSRISVELEELLSVALLIKGCTRNEKLIIEQTFLIPQQTEHDRGVLDIRLWRFGQISHISFCV